MATKKLPPEVLQFFRDQGRKGGKLGGKRSLETMTPEERTERARKAGAVSAAKKRAKKAKAKKTAKKGPKKK
jgi:hypothetical protein